MTTFWSLFIIVITLATIAGCAALLIWCNKDLEGISEGEELPHEYDGIRETNNPLPKWWTYLFWATIIFALSYLLFYPGLGNFAGLFNWQSSAQKVLNIESARQALNDKSHIDQYARELIAAEKIHGEIYHQLVYHVDSKELLDIQTIANNPAAIKVGQRLFIQNCAQCHGSNARGLSGFPNLTDSAWLYGGTPEAIKVSIEKGRMGNMPAWLAAFGEQGVRDISAYTLSLSGRKVNKEEIARGKLNFAVCAACHGTDGKGNPAFGAPNLTDNIWLYGGSRKDVENTIRYGRQGVMPAWENILSDDKIYLISAYVWKQSKLN